MNIAPWKKNAAIIAAAITVAAGVVAGREKPAVEVIQERPRPAADADIDLGRLRRPESALPENDPFARKFGQEKPVPAAAAAAPAKPAAPPLPFQYFGRLTENGKTEVFVMRGDELISLAPGQQLGDYRVDRIADATVSFTYLPMKLQQTMDLQ